MNTQSRRLRSILIVAAITTAVSVWGQESDWASFDSLSLGPVAVQPFLKNGFDAPYPWFGTEVIAGPMHFAYTQGNYYPEGEVSDADRQTGFIVTGGISFPFWPWLAPGKFSYESVRLVPFFDGGFAYAEIGIDGEEDKSFSWGFSMAPGVRLRIPFFYVDLRATGYLLINHTLIGRKDNQNGFSGFTFAPSLTLGIDGLYELLSDARYEQTVSEWVQKSQSYGSTKIVRDATDFDNDGNYTEAVERSTVYTESWWELEQTTYDYTLGAPFWGVGVRSLLHPGSPDRGPTAMVGPLLDARFGPLALDVYYQYGWLGKPDGVSFSMEVPDGPTVHLAGASVGFDIVKAGMPAIMRPDTHKTITNQQVSVGRLLGRGTYQVLWDSRLQADAPVGGVGAGIGLEFGGAAASWDYFWYPETPERDGGLFSFSALMPWGRVITAAQTKSP